MTTVPTKIVLKSTTRMSLNDRFSSIAPTVQNIRANMAAEQQVSAANRRLAQQLANRPGLQASAAGMYQQQRGGGARGNPAMRKMSVQQRLGKSNIKNRLSLPGGGQQRGRGRGRGRGGGLPIQGGGGDMSNRAKGRGGFSPRGSRGRGSIRARGRGVYNRFDEYYRGGENGWRGGGGGGRGRNRGGRPDSPEEEVNGRSMEFTGQNTVNRGNRRGGRGGIMRRGGRGQMRGRGGRGGRGGNSNVSVQDLDNQLDEYMSKSKSHLDQELDSYMSEVA